MKTQMRREFSLHLSRVGKDACEVVLTRIYLSKVLPAADVEIINSTFTHDPVAEAHRTQVSQMSPKTQDSGGLVAHHGQPQYQSELSHAESRRGAQRSRRFRKMSVKIAPDVRSNSVWLPKTRET
jgi:hypothetical protein